MIGLVKPCVLDLIPGNLSHILTGKMPLDPNAAWRRNTHMEFIMYVVNRNYCRCLFSSPDNCSAVWSKCNRTAQIWRSKLVSQDSKTCSYSGLMWKRLALYVCGGWCWCSWWLMLCWSCFYDDVFCFCKHNQDGIYTCDLFSDILNVELSLVDVLVLMSLCWCCCVDVVVLMWCPCVDVLVLISFLFMLFLYFLSKH